MKHGRRTVTVLAAAACLVVGGALGSGLINAGAATTGKSSLPTGSPRHGSNETAAHEKSESAAREAAEANGTATDGRPGHCHGGRSNEDPGHEAAESAAREAQESPGASQPTEPSSGAATTSPGT